MAESELDILDVKSLEGQGALFVLWPQCQSAQTVLVESRTSNIVGPGFSSTSRAKCLPRSRRDYRDLASMFVSF